MNWIIAQFARLSDAMEASNVGRFNRWSKFMGRKMFLGLVTMLLVTVCFITVLMTALFFGDVKTMTTIAGDFWNWYCGTMVTLFGAAAGTNVAEHSMNAKVAIANGSPKPPDAAKAAV